MDQRGLEMTTHNPARDAVERLRLHLKRVQADLEPHEQILVTPTTGEWFAISEIRAFSDSDFITFFGFDDEERDVSVVLHYTQLNVTFTAVPETEAPEAALKIRFLVDGEAL